MGLHLAVVERLAYSSEPESYASRDLYIPGRFNHAGQVKGEVADKAAPLALQVGGWARG